MAKGKKKIIRYGGAVKRKHRRITCIKPPQARAFRARETSKANFLKPVPSSGRTIFLFSFDSLSTRPSSAKTPPAK
ncbi:hypothetical protein JS73_01825 [Synergistes jonesii]|uniref:Uncharacterized protein n=1 Tax=Synergistes jonesii TaxID=2754 RepID=A0A073IUK2_9BACT|nr:hypothetical protein EH55_10470 [Synergistes jonesii]OFB63300.1 hypothetical protein JS72_06795 [Synergistes jonesii]OFB64865.1 hypothetical protein JS73_01825 [Synergistes jonesii]OFB66265.1 hypothetical protein JS79_01830 [Synergistes jonesii]OFB69032.1 hypothetical protein JS78_01830 [Synergistes jonesii]